MFSSIVYDLTQREGKWKYREAKKLTQNMVHFYDNLHNSQDVLELNDLLWNSVVLIFDAYSAGFGKSWISKKFTEKK